MLTLREDIPVEPMVTRSQPLFSRAGRFPVLSQAQGALREVQVSRAA